MGSFPRHMIQSCIHLGTPRQAYSLHSFSRRRYKCPQVTEIGMPTTQDLNLHFPWLLTGKGSKAILGSRTLSYSSIEIYKISVIYTHRDTHTSMYTCVYTYLWDSSWIKPSLTNKSFAYNKLCSELVTVKILGSLLYTLSQVRFARRKACDKDSCAIIY